MRYGRIQCSHEYEHGFLYSNEYLHINIDPHGNVYGLGYGDVYRYSYGDIHRHVYRHELRCPVRVCVRLWRGSRPVSGVLPRVR